LTGWVGTVFSRNTLSDPGNSARLPGMNQNRHDHEFILDQVTGLCFACGRDCKVEESEKFDMNRLIESIDEAFETLNRYFKEWSSIPANDDFDDDFVDFDE
jgi:hypothetical protein